MKESVIRNIETRQWLRRIDEPTVFTDNRGNLLGTWVPAGQEPPTAPPEPPTASAAVGAHIPRRPLSGGPGAAAVVEDEWQPVGDWESVFR